jgi:hypothetical protein
MPIASNFESELHHRKLVRPREASVERKHSEIRHADVQNSPTFDELEPVKR